jgi:transcription elongation factor Elf1
MKEYEQKLRKIVCPICGKATNVGILKLDGVIRYSLKCRNCKKVSEVEIRDIR